MMNNLNTYTEQHNNYMRVITSVTLFSDTEEVVPICRESKDMKRHKTFREVSEKKVSK